MAVNDFLQQEVTKLAGARYNRIKEKRDIIHWGSQPGSVYLQDTKVKVLNGLSCHKYSEAAQKVPEIFGLGASSISKRFIRASARKLKDFNFRRLEKYDIVAILLILITLRFVQFIFDDLCLNYAQLTNSLLPLIVH